MLDFFRKKGADAAHKGQPMPETRNLPDQQAKTIVAGYNKEKERQDQERRDEEKRRQASQRR